MVAMTSSLSRVVDILTDAPSPERVMSIKGTEEEEARLDYLSQRQLDGLLTVEERAEIDSYLMAEHLVRMAKIKAYSRLRDAS